MRNLATAVVFLAWQSTLLAAELDFDEALAYVTDDVVAAGFVRLERVDVAAALGELQTYGVPPEVLARESPGLERGQLWMREMAGYGAPTMVALLRTQDVIRHGPAWVLPLTSRAQGDRAAGLLLSEEPGKSAARGNRSEILPNFARVDDGAVVGAMDEEQLAACTIRSDATIRGDAAAALAALGDADAGVTIFGSTDARRVLREMWPTAPAPFMEVDGALLADGVKFVAVAVDLPPEARVRLIIETGDDASAQIVDGAFQKLIAVGKAAALAELASAAPDHKARGKALLELLAAATPKTEGRRTTLTLVGDTMKSSLQAAFGPALKEGRETIYRPRRMDNFKHLALAMLNFESANRTLPPAASYDKAGKPLLSWRVLALPYMEQKALYNEFHLDEPWDSPHNLKLVERMPDLFADPDPILRAQIGPGRTTFQVPRGEGTAFAGREGMKYRDMIDGTSNTVMLVEVVPERAVAWTKPDDWEVDFQDPLRGVKRSDRTWWTTTFVDGHARIFQDKIKPKAWSSVLTAAGEDIVDYSEF